jgi:lipopolysaccharide export LptBFGC system permease protein LptF
MSEILEMLMVISFGAAWPASIMKSLRSRSAKGKSLSFLIIVLFGYLCGILSKFVSGNLNYVVVFYIINMMMVACDTVIYLRNQKFDMAKEKEEEINLDDHAEK